MKNKALLVSGLIFGLIAIVHLLRVFYPFSIIIAGVSIPLWVNAIAFIAFALLSIWMFRSFYEKCKHVDL